MPRIIFIVGVCLLTTVCFAQEQERYNNQERHFSFVLPQDWEVIPENQLPSEDRELIENTFRKSKPVAVCQEVGTKYFTTPYILVLFRSTEEVPETEIEKVFRDQKDILMKNLKKRIELLKKTEGGFPKSWQGAKQRGVKVDYDRDRHISFEIAKLHQKDVGSIAVVTVKLLGSHRMVTLHCFADGTASENFLNVVNDVVDSFRYEEGYGFGEAKRIAPGLTQKLLGRGIWSWIWPILGISLLFWVLGRWARG